MGRYNKGRSRESSKAFIEWKSGGIDGVVSKIVKKLGETAEE